MSAGLDCVSVRRCTAASPRHSRQDTSRRRRQALPAPRRRPLPAKAMTAGGFGAVAGRLPLEVRLQLLHRLGESPRIAQAAPRVAPPVLRNAKAPAMQEYPQIHLAGSVRIEFDIRLHSAGQNDVAGGEGPGEGGDQAVAAPLPPDWMYPSMARCYPDPISGRLRRGGKRLSTPEGRSRPGRRGDLGTGDRPACRATRPNLGGQWLSRATAWPRQPTRKSMSAPVSAPMT
jgi:hypothetical protein